MKEIENQLFERFQGVGELLPGVMMFLVCLTIVPRSLAQASVVYHFQQSPMKNGVRSMVRDRVGAQMDWSSQPTKGLRHLTPHTKV